MRKAIHFGAGPIQLRSQTVDWVNVDISDQYPQDKVMDYLKISQEFPEHEFSFGFSCHSLEHLSMSRGIRSFFEESRKVIQPGGILRIVVPDLMKVARKYVAGEDLKDIYDGPYFDDVECPAERFKYFCRSFEHTVLFDERLLRFFAEEAGWKNFQIMPFGKSQVPEMCNIDRFESESLISECEA